MGGRRALEAAEVVVHDRLGTGALLALCPPGAVLVDAGKAPGRAAMTQDEINAELVRHALAGRAVVRLKGGDPFVFGRGGEEAQALRAAGIDYVVVPGVTSAVAAPAYAGIPVTHRGLSTALTVVTGHEDPGKPSEQTDWAALAAVPGTLVILMGMGRLAEIAAALVDGGRDPDEPAAAVQWGTTPRQRSVTATLGTIATRRASGPGSAPRPWSWSAPWPRWAARSAGRPPAPSWGGGWPSPGPARRRATWPAPCATWAPRWWSSRSSASSPLPPGPEIDAALDALGEYDLVVLTSVNGVDTLFSLLAERGADARRLSAASVVVAIGPATAARLAEHGVRADVVPERFVAEGILEALAGRDLAGRRALVARAREARPDLVEGLRARGAAVDEVALYETVVERPPAEVVEAALECDWVTFTSSSTARNWREVVGVRALARAARPRAVSIGPITSATLAEIGIPVAAEAEEFTIAGLVAALLADAAAA